MEVWHLFVAASLVGFFNGISPTGITLLVLSLKNQKNILEQEISTGDIISNNVGFEAGKEIKDKGKVDLIITSAKATCGCTVPEWPKDPIAPGASADLKFTFNSRGRVGKQSKSITLQTNSEKVTELIRIKGTVVKKS